MDTEQAMEKLSRLWTDHGTDLTKLKREIGKLIKQGRETGDFLLLGASYYYLAAANWRIGGERDAVLLNAIKATALLEQTKNYRMIARSNNMLGIAYLGQENYQMALDSYNKTYQIAKKHRSCNVHDRLITLNNIADCYYEMGDYRSSLRVFLRCLDEANRKTPENHINITLYSVNLANNYEKLGNYEEALSVLERISGWVDDVEMKMWVCLYYGRKASILYAMGRISEGNECADKALAIIDGDSDTYEFHKEFEELAHTLIDCGDYERAMIFAKILKDYSDKSGHTIDLLMTCRVMAHYYSKTGDHALALSTYEELNRLYEMRTIETKAMQLTILKKIKEAGREISKLNKTIKASEETASRDPLSGLLNRAALLDTASEYINAAAKKREKVGAVFIDIDHFKECNDTYGHAKGDEVIRTVAAACLAEETSCVRFARYGGDEFFGITHGLKDGAVVDIARRICEKIRSANIPNVKNPNGHIITLSVGLMNSGVTKTTNTIIDIVNCADKALYHAKESGRNAIVLFDFEHRDAEGRISPYISIEP